jgi:hypothetical protein
LSCREALFVSYAVLTTPQGFKIMADVVEIARKRLAELEAEADQLRTYLAVHASLTGQKSVDGGVADDSSGEFGEDTATPAEIVEGAKALMAEHRRPLSRSKLVKLLTAKGLKLPGQDKSKNIGTVIWRSKQFDNIAGMGYWPKAFHGWIGQAPAQADMLGSNIP